LERLNPRRDQKPTQAASDAALAFEHAIPPPSLRHEPQAGVTNYTWTRCSKWRLGVKSYAAAQRRCVSGVDVVYYGDHRRLEFDFVVAPKADPSAMCSRSPHG